MRLNVKSAQRFFEKQRSKQNDKDRELWPVVKNYYDLGLEMRRPFEREWIVNLAFLAGRQYVFFNSQAHMLQQISRIKGRERKVDNIIMPKWRRQVADLIRDDPQMTVVPNTNEDEDVKSAKVATKVLQYFWRTSRMKRKRRELAGWIYATGNGFLDDRWNPRLGPTSLDPKSGKLVYLGDVDAGVWSPFEVILPVVFLGDTDLHKMPWLIKAKWRTLDYIRGLFPRDGERVTSESFPNPIMGADLVGGRFGMPAPRVEGATLMECYIQPCKDYPKGKFVTGANGIILQETDYPFNSYNIEHFKDIRCKGETDDP